MCLSSMGKEGRGAVPALVEAVEDEDAAVDYAAYGALIQADPRAAAKTGGPRAAERDTL